MRLAFAILLLAAHAQAATLYVKPVTDVVLRTAFDSASTNDGAWVGGVSYSTNAPFAGGGSAVFDGTSGYIDLGQKYNQYLNGAPAITLEAWVNTSRTNRQELIQGHTQPEGYYGWALVAENGTIGIGGRSTGTETFQGYLAAPAPTGSWVHAAGVIDYANGQLSMYIDGVLATNASASWGRTNFLGTVPSLGANIGAGNAFNSHTLQLYFAGNLFEARIWNVARTPEEIAANYTNRLTGTETNLVGYWRLDERQLDGLDWQYAYTNIQSAINAAAAGDTVMVAPGTYEGAGFGDYVASANKPGLTLVGGDHGTLWDADRTIISASKVRRCLYISASNVTVRGLSFIDGGPTIDRGSGIRVVSPAVNTRIENCIFRGHEVGVNPSSAIRNEREGTIVANCIIVGGSTTLNVDQNAGSITFVNSIVEANENRQLYSFSGTMSVQNTIHGNTAGVITSLGGNITNNTTNSVLRLLNIAPASDGVGTNLQWAGVAAYIPRIGSLAQDAGVGYAGIDAAKSGDGGPALWPPFGEDSLGRDSSTNANHGIPIGGVTASTNSPFAGEGGSAAFDGTINTEVWFGERQSLNVVSNFTIEVWVAKASNVFERFLSNSSVAGAAAYELGSNFSNPNQWRLFINNSAVIFGNITYAPWVHIAVSRSGSQVVMYQNGSPIATATYATAISGHGAVSTRRQNPASYGNVGFTVSPLSDLRIWSVARTPAEIAANYTNRLTGTEAGLVGYWRLDEDESETPITTGPFNLRNPTLQPTFMEAF